MSAVLPVLCVWLCLPLFSDVVFFLSVGFLWPRLRGCARVSLSVVRPMFCALNLSPATLPSRCNPSLFCLRLSRRCLVVSHAGPMILRSLHMLRLIRTCVRSALSLSPAAPIALAVSASTLCVQRSMLSDCGLVFCRICNTWPQSDPDPC